MYKRRFKDKDGNVSEREFSKTEVMTALNNSWDAFINRSSFIECSEYEKIFVVNNQDFHQITICPDCKR